MVCHAVQCSPCPYTPVPELSTLPYRTTVHSSTQPSAAFFTLFCVSQSPALGAVCGISRSWHRCYAPLASNGWAPNALLRAWARGGWTDSSDHSDSRYYRPYCSKILTLGVWRGCVTEGGRDHGCGRAHHVPVPRRHRRHARRHAQGTPAPPPTAPFLCTRVYSQSLHLALFACAVSPAQTQHDTHPILC